MLGIFWFIKKEFVLMLSLMGKSKLEDLAILLHLNSKSFLKKKK